jgi:hypothetical protein
MGRRIITPEQLKKAELEMTQAKNRLADLKAQNKAHARREKRTLDNRRKILVGAWALAEMQKNGDFKTLALAGLKGFLTREIDQAAFPELTAKNQNGALRAN